MKVIYIIIGSLALGLGLLGMFLPLLPTTPFLLLSAAMYFKGSERLYNWLLSRKIIGEYIRQFRETKAIPLHAKIISVTMIWLTILYCIFFVLDKIYLQILLFVIALSVSVHILRYKTLRKK